MAAYYTDGGSVDMYVDEVAMEITAHNQDIWASADEGGDEAADDEGGVEAADDDMAGYDLDSPRMQTSSMALYNSPSKSMDSSSDEEYKQPSEEDSSANDEEATEFRNYARQIKRNIIANKFGIHGSQVVDIRAEDLVDEVPNLDEPGSPFLDSSDDYSYEENSDGEAQKWKTVENRFDSKAEVPVFCGPPG